MDLAAKGWIPTPHPKPLPVPSPRPRAVPRFPHLPGAGTFLTSCLMHFEPTPLGKSRSDPEAGEPRTPRNPPACM